VKIETNYILLVSRLPIHFWNEMNFVPDYRDNPGLWLLSYVVAKSLQREYTDLPANLSPAFKECEEFTEKIEDVVQWFDKQVKGLVEASGSVPKLHVQVNTFAYNYFAGMALNAALPNRREMLITNKLLFDQLREVVLSPPPEPQLA